MFVPQLTGSCDVTATMCAPTAQAHPMRESEFRRGRARRRESLIGTRSRLQAAVIVCHAHDRALPLRRDWIGRRHPTKTDGTISSGVLRASVQ
jgi:hypothetical protein